MCQYNSVSFDLSLEPFNLCALVFKLRAELIGSNLLRLHDLHQVDVLLHEYLTLDDEVRVAEKEMLTERWRTTAQFFYFFVFNISLQLNTPNEWFTYIEY